jgi:hypothetical protein
MYAGHVADMLKTSNAYKIFTGKLQGIGQDIDRSKMLKWVLQK